MTAFDYAGVLWAEATRDGDAEAQQELLLRGKLATAAFWPFLASAQSEAEFGHRLALIEDRVAAVVPEPVLEPVLASVTSDWKALNDSRQATKTAAGGLSHEQARTLAAQWHSPGDRAMSALSTSGAIPDVDDLHRSIDVAKDEAAAMGNQTHVGELDKLHAYVDKHGPRDSVDGWHHGWDSQYERNVLSREAHRAMPPVRPDDEIFDVSQGRWVRVSYIDPSDAQRYSHYPDMNPPVDNGPLQGPDGFVTGGEGDAGRSDAIIQQRQLTPGQWTVTPGTEWPVRPNAADPTQVPRTAARQAIGGVDVTGWSEPEKQRLLQGMASFDKMAGEGIVPTPGPNPNYFSQGSEGIAGPPTFPENPSSAIEPKTDNRIDDLYGAVPPQASSGSAQGLVDGQGYSRQVPGSSATAGRHPFFDSPVRAHVDHIADQLYIGGGDSDWRKRAATDGRIVGHCDNCNQPVRYHTNEGGVDELRHLHNNHNSCSNGQKAASLRRSTAFFDPKDASVQVLADGVSRQRPTLNNPSGAGDEYDANTWDNAVTQRPMQSAQDRGINTPTTPRDPIGTVSSEPGRTDDDNRNQNGMARETALARYSIEDLMEV